MNNPLKSELGLLHVQISAVIFVLGIFSISLLQELLPLPINEVKINHLLNFSVDPNNK
jgi:hypothetical protein